ncbi:hypothetical protein VTL71DRAFT_5758 [Oculimacula yallundae]|uniref:2Fe-2S ferredoxin-type domain-containing protein n=1 Tax=Oculimacula yallundae TaxID=86028 RepID=A0ABR4BZX5_9HELO
MSTARTVVGGLSGVGRRSIQCLKRFERQSIVRNRASLSTAARWQSSTADRSQRQSQVSYGPGRNVAGSIARRTFSATSAASHGHWEPPPKGKELYVTFVDKDGNEDRIAVSEGDNLLTVAQANDIEMEGACEGSCTCSTCHVIVQSEDMFDKIPEADDDENDMLDLAFGLTETSRLGCQIVMKPELDGLVVRLPSMTRNMQASDFEKKK